MKNFRLIIIPNRSFVALLILAFLPVLRISGQNPEFERLNAYKIGFFTKKLNLTPKEAEDFWPVYNAYQGRKNEIQKERILLNRNTLQNAANMSDKELTEVGDRVIALQMDEANLALEYHKKFKEILPPFKVLKLYQAENQYRIQLLNELKDRKPVQRR